MKLIYIWILIFSFPAFAGFKKGNGGNILICENSSQLLDFFEGEIIYSYRYDKNNQSNWKDVVLEKIESLPLIYSNTKLIYKNWLSTFEAEALFLPNVDLGTINDSLHVVIPDGCVLKQTVNQQLNPLPSEKRYWISKNIWDKISNFDKAGLVFHELVYRSLAEFDSRNTREFTAKVFSNEFGHD